MLSLSGLMLHSDLLAGLYSVSIGSVYFSRAFGQTADWPTTTVLDQLKRVMRPALIMSPRGQGGGHWDRLHGRPHIDDLMITGKNMIHQNASTKQDGGNAWHFWQWITEILQGEKEQEGAATVGRRAAGDRLHQTTNQNHAWMEKDTFIARLPF